MKTPEQEFEELVKCQTEHQRMYDEMIGGWLKAVAIMWFSFGILGGGGLLIFVITVMNNPEILGLMFG